MLYSFLFNNDLDLENLLFTIISIPTKTVSNYKITLLGIEKNKKIMAIQSISLFLTEKFD